MKDISGRNTTYGTAFGLSCRFWLAAAATLALLSPVGGSAQDMPVIRVASTLNDSGAGVYYAADMGFYRKAGLDVRIVSLGSAGLLGPSVASGALDIGETGVSVIATAHAKGLPFVIVAPAGMYSSKGPTSGLIGLKSAGWSSGADLDGRTIAVRDINSPAYMGLRAWVDAHGGDSKTIKFVEIPDHDAAGAIEQHRVDGAVVSEPDLQNAIDSSDLKMVAPVYDAIAPEFLLGAYFTTVAFQRAHPDLVQKFSTAMAETYRWANAHPRESAAILAKYAKTTVDPAMPRVTYVDRVNPALVQPLIDVAVRYGKLPASFPAADLFASAAGR